MQQADSTSGGLLALFFVLVVAALVLGAIAMAQIAEVRRELAALRRRGSEPIIPETATPHPAGSPPPLPIPIVPAASPVSPSPAMPVVDGRRLTVGPAAEITDPTGCISERLRGLGLLPPRNLSGEYAIGAWWAARIGSVVGAAALIFLGIWLNLRSSLPAWVRLAELLGASLAVAFAGLRLGRTRPDLGRVLGVVGLVGLQFGAWAAHNLAGLRVIQEPLAGWTVSLAVTGAWVAVALWRNSLALARASALLSALQLGVALCALDVADVTVVLLFPGVVLLGALPVALRGWVSVGFLSLVACLPSLHLALMRAGHVNDTRTQLLLAAAVALPFLIATRWARRNQESEPKAMVALELAAFLKPVILLQFSYGGGHGELGWVDASAASLALILGLASRRKDERLAESCFFAAAIVLAGLGIVQWADDDWASAVWMAASGIGLFVAVRLGLAPMLWLAEALACVAAVSFCSDRPQGTTWLCALPLFHGVLLALRERVDGQGSALRTVVGIVGSAAVVFCSGMHLDRERLALGWAVPMALAALLGSRRWLAAVAPFIVLFAYPSAIFGLPHRTPDGQLAIECLLFALLAALAVDQSNRRLNGRVRDAAVVASLLALAPILAALPNDLAKLAGLPWQRPSGWVLATIGLLGLCELGRRRSIGRLLEVLPLASVLPWVVLLSNVGTGADEGQWPAAMLLLAGHLIVLLALHRAESQVPWLAAAFSLLAIICGLPHLPGTWGSLVIGLLAVMTFVAGHLSRSRGERLAGLICLALASGRVVFHDLSDVFDRIVACGALAGAFFGIAWLYARWSRSRPV